MKIAQVNVYFYPVMVGGVEWYVYNISRELVRRGHEIHVYTADTYRGEKLRPSEDVVDGIQVHRVPLWFDLTYRFKIWKGLENQLVHGDFDIIHAYDYAQFQSFAAARAGKIARIPVAITVFDLHSLIPRALYKQIPMLVYDRFFSKWLLRMVDKILIRTPNLESHLIEFGAPKEKIIATPSGILREALDPADGWQFREKHGIKGPLILFMGRLHPTKGLQHLVKAAPMIVERTPEAKIVVTGPDQVGFKKVLKGLVMDLGVEESVFFHDAIYDLHRKMQAYAACDVFVLPSGYEGLGQVIVEAMAQGKPIVATRVGGIPFLVKNGREGLLVNYGDSESLAQAILKIISDEKLATTMGNKGKEKASFLTYDVLANQLEKVYEGMVENKE